MTHAPPVDVDCADIKAAHPSLIQILPHIATNDVNMTITKSF